MGAPEQLGGIITHHRIPPNAVTASVAYLWWGRHQHKPRIPGITLGPHRRGYRVVTSSSLPNMESLNASDHGIRFSVPTHQRSTFNRAIIGLPPAFSRVLSLLLRVRLGCKGVLIGQEFASGTLRLHLKAPHRPHAPFQLGNRGRHWSTILYSSRGNGPGNTKRTQGEDVPEGWSKVNQ